MKGIRLSKGAVERRISDMPEDTETQLSKNLKNRNFLHSNWTNLQIFRPTTFYLHMYDILTMMSDMKEDILSVSELPTHMCEMAVKFSKF